MINTANSRVNETPTKFELRPRTIMPNVFSYNTLNVKSKLTIKLDANNNSKSPQKNRIFKFREANSLKTPDNSS